MVRNSLSYVSYKDRKVVAADLRLVYTASTETEAEQQLVSFADKWDKQYPTISKSWLNHWQRTHHSIFCLPSRNSQSHLHYSPPTILLLKWFTWRFKTSLRNGRCPFAIGNLL
jgi:hypothetical protein